MHDGVAVNVIGGEQVLLCRAVYEPGATVERHSHADSEQLMLVVEGSVEMTVGGERKTLEVGDVAVVNRGVEHELYSPNGVTFIEAFSPVPPGHVRDPERDLVRPAG
jgi:quercetin dioxygenase-like cupin family protein